MANSTKKDASRAQEALKASSNSKMRKSNTNTAGYVGGYEKIVDKAIQLKFVADSVKNIYSDTEIEIIGIAEKIYESRAREGIFSKSVNLAGEEFEGLNVSFSDCFSPIPVESADLIIKAYVNSGLSKEEAKEAFAKNFQEIRTVKMADTSNETISILDTLLKFGKLLSSDNADLEDIATSLNKLRKELRSSISRGGKIDFGEIFSGEVVLSPTTGMDERQFDQPETIRGLLKQKKASTKVKTKVATAAAADNALREVFDFIREKIED